MPLIYPVILSGGVGSRLWPLSQRNFPKQFLALVGERSLIQETALHSQGPGFADPVIICNVEHRFVIAEQMRGIGVTPHSIILEPNGRNTAPAAAVAALKIAQTEPDAILLLMPADHLIKDLAAFRQAVQHARLVAERGYLVTFGIEPTAPETGYGYIQRGQPLSEAHSFSVSRFVEKPDRSTAESYIAAGDYYWNSGIFAFRADVFLEELGQCEPDIVDRCKQALSTGKQDLDFFRLDGDRFAECKAISVDYAVMEYTKKAAMIRVDMEWSDIGSWEALWAASSKDDRDNAIRGKVLVHNSQNSYLRSEGPMIAAIGLAGMIVVATPDAVLVMPKTASQEVKKIVDQLEKECQQLQNSDYKT